MTLMYRTAFMLLVLSAVGSSFSGVEPMFDKGEAFSGAWFGQASQLVESPKVLKNMKVLQSTSRQMCEAASFMLFQRLGGPRDQESERWGNPPGQTVDLFDFSVLHLSSTERLFNKHLRNLVPKEVNAILDELNAFYCSSTACKENIRRFAEVDLSTSSASPLSTSRQKKQTKTSDEQSSRRRLAVTMERSRPDSKDFSMTFNTSMSGASAKKEEAHAKRLSDSKDNQETELKYLKLEVRRIRSILDKYRVHATLIPDTYDLSLIDDGVRRALVSIRRLRDDALYQSTGSGVAASNDNSKDLKLKFILRSSDERRSRGVKRRAGALSTGESQTALTAWLKTTLFEEVQLAAKLLSDGKDDVGVLETSLLRTARCVRAFLSTGRTGDRDMHLDGSNTGADGATQLQSMLDSTVVVIPWLRARGQGNSMETFRGMYLRLTIMSLRPFFQNIYVVVKSTSDRDFLLDKEVSGPTRDLPITDVWYVPDLATDCRLPPAAVREVRRRLRSGEWDLTSHKYVYFTEADQIFFGRNLPYLYNWMNKNPRSILTPHRLVVSAPAFLKQRGIGDMPVSNLHSDMSKHSCCMDTSGYGRTRIHWKNVSDVGMQLVQVHNVQVFPANVNLWGQLYRSCNVTTRDSFSGCPWNPAHEDYSS